MGRTLNYFKEYKIEQDEELLDNIIKNYGGGEIDYSYNSLLKITMILSLSKLDIPSHDWVNPPKDGKLGLMEPIELSRAFEKGLDLLRKEQNPQIGGKNLFNDAELERYRNGLINTLQELKKLSDEGYYLVLDFDQ